MIRVFGISFRIHPLFTLLLIFSVMIGNFVELLTLFGIVLIHELGHVTAALSFGWRVRQVQLLPFGGVAEVEESTNVPVREEWLVALAGPLQNVWMILLGWSCLSAGIGDPDWWEYFMEANLMIALFNMIPVLPLDGGKLLMAWISLKVSYHKAITLGAWIGLFFSVLLAAASFFQPFGGGVQLNLLVIGIFLFTSNWYSLKSVPYLFMRFLMSRAERTADKIRRGTMAQPILALETHTVADLMRLFMREKVHVIYVMDEKGTIRSVLPEERLIRHYFDKKKPGSAVSELIV